MLQYRIGLRCWIFILTMIAGMVNAYDTSAKVSPRSGLDSFTIKQLTVKGYDLKGENSTEEALQYYFVAAHRYREGLSLEDKYYAVIAMNNIGDIYLSDRNNAEIAYRWLARAERIAVAENFNVLLPGLYDNLAKIHSNYGDIQAAIDLLKKGFKMAKDSNLKSSKESPNTRHALMLMVFNDLVAVAMEHNRLPDISDEIKEIQTIDLPDIPMAQYTVTLSQALTQLLQSNPAEAQRLLNLGSQQIDISVDSLRYAVNHNLYTAKAAQRAGKPQDALRYLNIALNCAQKGHLKDMSPKILLEKGGLIPDSILQFRVRAYEIRDSLYGAQSLVRIKDLETAETIDTMAAENAALTEKHRQRTITIYAMCAVLVLIASLVIMLILRNRKLTAANRAMVNTYRTSAIEKKITASVETSNTAMPVDERHVDERHKEAVAAAVREVMASSREIFSADFSLEQLAQIIKIKPKYLSTIINEVFGRNLNTLLAEARIREACNMLNDPQCYPQLTLDAIAAKVGYRSRTHFSSVFKKITGMSPSKWASIAREQDQIDS